MTSLIVISTFSIGLALAGIALAISVVRRAQGPNWVAVMLSTIAGIGGAIVGFVVGFLVYLEVWKPHK